MKYMFYIGDVFSSEPFGGNQVAVLPDARGIGPEGMLKITQEFRFTECAFVFPPTETSENVRLRIFNPVAEMDFAGHPTLGAASALVHGGHASPPQIVFEENVGLIPVTVEQVGDRLHSMLTTTSSLKYVDRKPEFASMARVLSLREDDIEDVFFAGAGLNFCFVQLTTESAVDRAVVDSTNWEKYLANEWSSNVFFFFGELIDSSELFARMSAPALGAYEDPATGSAAVALVGAAAVRNNIVDGSFSISVRQGVKMGRPSYMRASAKMEGGAPVSLSVGGATHIVASGEIEIGDQWLE